jgi:hypothetical protein
MACTILLLFTAKAYPSYDTEAGRKYTIACQRAADLRKSAKKKKYRSYWMDCIRTFELVEKKYPKSPSAADACFDRAGLYLELYQFNKYSQDLDESVQVYGKCQAAYPKHARHRKHFTGHRTFLDNRKNGSLASKPTISSPSVPDSIWTDKARTRLGLSFRNRRGNPKSRKCQYRCLLLRGRQTGRRGAKIRYWSGGHIRVS